MKIISLKKIKCPFILANISWFLWFCSSFFVQWRSKWSWYVWDCSLFVWDPKFEHYWFRDDFIRSPLHMGYNKLDPYWHLTLKQQIPVASKSLCSSHSFFFSFLFQDASAWHKRKQYSSQIQGSFRHKGN